MNTEVSWESLLETLNSDQKPHNDKAWAIYRYMQANVGDGLSSEEARTLLLCYMKLAVVRPSLIHSLMLGIAVKMADKYSDFRLIPFLNMWKVNSLREDDMTAQVDKDGKTYSSLIEKVTKAYIRYSMSHPEETLEESFREIINNEAIRLGFKCIKQMIAVKMFESEKAGRKLRSVKIVSPEGDELLVDWHNFNAKPWEIVGKMYDVLMREAKTGTVRAEYIQESKKNMADVFTPKVGFVEHFATEHGHYHIYDNQSRHFVAENPKVKPQIGDFVMFCPVIPKVDKFKSAVVLNVVDKYDGRMKFGVTSATVAFVNQEKNYIKYKTEDGAEGFCNLDRCPSGIKQGDAVQLIIFLKRGKDGEKRPYVAQVF